MDDRTEFAVRYYRWALDQWRREIDEDFPLLRSIPNSACKSTIEFLGSIPRARWSEVTLSWVKRLNGRAVEALGETFSAEEQKLWRESVQFRTECYKKHDDGLIKRRKKIAPLRAAIRELVFPLLGAEAESVRGVLYNHELKIGRWAVQTRVDFTDRWSDVSYAHEIRESEARSLSDGISVVQWFGIRGGDTQFEIIAEEAIPTAAAAMAAVCRRFLEAAPHLVP